ncbi:hypothetical protein D3C81_1679370 [compost metagenome]
MPFLSITVTVNPNKPLTGFNDLSLSPAWFNTACASASATTVFVNLSSLAPARSNFAASTAFAGIVTLASEVTIVIATPALLILLSTSADKLTSTAVPLTSATLTITDASAFTFSRSLAFPVKAFSTDSRPFSSLSSADCNFAALTAATLLPFTSSAFTS